jgi:hypothetical protein
MNNSGKKASWAWQKREDNDFGKSGKNVQIINDVHLHTVLLVIFL